MELDLSVPRKKIVVLASSPSNASWLRTDVELREIEEGLRSAKKRDFFILEKRSATRARDLQRALLDIEPDIVHFCGHGLKGGLILEDERGEAQEVRAEALADLFRLFAESVECVVLNACYTEEQAEVIARYIPYVVGMNGAILDRSAIRFACGFYDALGAGRHIEFAFQLACNALLLDSKVPEPLMPVLKSGPSRLLKKPKELFDFAMLRDMSSAQISELLESLRTALTRSPSSPELHHRLGRLYLQRRLYGEAQEHFRCEAQLVPESSEAHYYYALTLIGGRRPKNLSKEEVQEIEQHLTLATRLDPRRAKYLYLLAVVKYDYYFARSLPMREPSYDQLLRQAERAAFESREMEILLEVVNIKDSHLARILRRDNPSSID
jgi:tetratricopeptide (TPR) repeat protein